MVKNKKILMIILIALIIAIFIVVGIILVINKKPEADNLDESENSVENEEEIDLDTLFSNIDYSIVENEIVYLAYDIEETKSGKYDINAKIPLLNLETETIKTINNEINNSFTNKLIDIIKNSTAHTIYNVDYRTFTNGNILSVIIKCTLKEGTNPQRVIMQTYNYDLENDKILSLEEIINLKNLDKTSIQSQIIDSIEGKNNSQKVLAEQGYNVYVRDINSEEYLVENVKTYFLGENEKLYIVFAYGNTNFTKEMDWLVI